MSTGGPTNRRLGLRPRPPSAPTTLSDNPRARRTSSDIFGHAAITMLAYWNMLEHSLPPGVEQQCEVRVFGRPEGLSFVRLQVPRLPQRLLPKIVQAVLKRELNLRAVGQLTGLLEPILAFRQLGRGVKPRFRGVNRDLDDVFDRHGLAAGSVDPRRYTGVKHLSSPLAGGAPSRFHALSLRRDKFTVHRSDRHSGGTRDPEGEVVYWKGFAQRPRLLGDEKNAHRKLNIRKMGIGFG